MQGLMMHRPLRIIDILTYAAECFPDEGIVSASVHEGIHRATYPEILGRVAQLARALGTLGIEHGDRVATMAWNSHRHFELYYAVSGMGAVCHTINPRLSDEQLIYILHHANDRILFLDQDFAPAIDRLRDRLPSGLICIILTHTDQMPATETEYLCYEDLLSPHSTQYDWPEFPEDTASGLCYTSGTTGDPKGALYSHRSTVLHAMMVPLAQTSSFRAGRKIFPVVPMFHVNAWGAPYTAPLMGMTLVMPGAALDGASLYRLMDTEHVYSAWGVPTVWAGLMAEIEHQNRVPDGFVDLVVGGSAMARSAIEAFEAKGVGIRQCWGMTETSPVGAHGMASTKLRDTRAEDRIAAMSNAGSRVFGVDYKIVDADGNPLPHDGIATGELFVRGNAVISGYYDNNAATDAAMDNDGWLGTGDVASVDPIGRLTITDRAKDLIKSGGEWISSIDLENTALSHPEIATCAVIAMPHPKWDERPVLVAVPIGDERPTLEQLHVHMAPYFAGWQLPDDIIYVDALPLTATAKVSKRTLRKQFEGYVLPEFRKGTS